MELQAKEMRFVILGLKRLLEETKNKIDGLSEDGDDDVPALINDAVLIDAMISGFELEYEKKFR